jgi:hypothetical protein
MCLVYISSCLKKIFNPSRHETSSMPHKEETLPSVSIMPKSMTYRDTAYLKLESKHRNIIPLLIPKAAKHREEKCTINLIISFIIQRITISFDVAKMFSSLEKTSSSACKDVCEKAGVRICRDLPTSIKPACEKDVLKQVNKVKF